MWSECKQPQPKFELFANSTFLIDYHHTTCKSILYINTQSYLSGKQCHPTVHYLQMTKECSIKIKLQYIWTNKHQYYHFRCVIFSILMITLINDKHFLLHKMNRQTKTCILPYRLEPSFFVVAPWRQNSVNLVQTEIMCFNQHVIISSLNSKPLKLVDQFIYLGNNIIYWKWYQYKHMKSMVCYWQINDHIEIWLLW